MTNTTIQPFLVRRSFTADCWWVTEGEWRPGHAESIKARCTTMAEAVEIANAHNRLLGKIGRPVLPFSVALIHDAMSRADWNITAAAKRLGVNRKTLHRWFVARENANTGTKTGGFVPPSAKTGGRR